MPMSYLYAWAVATGVTWCFLANDLNHVVWFYVGRVVWGVQSQYVHCMHRTGQKFRLSSVQVPTSLGVLALLTVPSAGCGFQVDQAWAKWLVHCFSIFRHSHCRSSFTELLLFPETYVPFTVIDLGVIDPPSTMKQLTFHPLSMQYRLYRG